MNKVKVKVTGEGEFDLKWLVRIVIGALIFLAVVAAGGTIIINL